MKVKSIPFQSLEGVRVGNITDAEAKTGVTVFYMPGGALGAVEVLGGGPASRETPLLEPQRSNTPVNALVLSGGSAFGLAASDGVMKCLEEHGIGFDTTFALVPIVCQSCIYDLSYGSSTVRPNSQMGYDACSLALQANNPQSGSVGAGAGATIGKMSGMEYCQKAGIGYAAGQVGELQVGVVALVNSLGDIYENGIKIGGMMNEDRTAFADSEEKLYSRHPENLFSAGQNTTLISVFLNADFPVSSLKKIAQMASAGLMRSVRPVATMADGDTVYAFSVGKVPADVNVAGTLAATLTESAIADAVRSSN